jgi:hypothetical protein
MSKIVISKPNGEEEVREMTSEEQAQWNKDIVELASIKEAEKTAKAQKDADALAGNNKLLELGLTQAQVTAMTGYTPPVSQ